MRIGINCLNIDPSYMGGVNTYTLGILDGFSQVNKTHTFIIFATTKNRALFRAFENKPNFEIVVIDAFDHTLKRKIIWQLVKVEFKYAYKVLSNLLFKEITDTITAKCDLVYFPNTTIFPYAYPIPTILSMHDIQQVHYPEFFSPIQLKSRNLDFNLSAEAASYMQASSEFMKKDFLAYFKTLKPEQIFVNREGVSIEAFRNHIANVQVKEKYNLPDKYLFYPAQLWPHKNHITILKALLHLKREHGMEVPLVLTGAQYGAYNEIMDFLNTNGLDYVYYLGKVPFEDLLSLYKMAYYLIIAVVYESSSIPILEAAACGIPIIASATPPNAELSKILHVNLFETMNEKELAQLIVRVWNDEEYRLKQIRHNNEHIEQFSWANIAKHYLRFIESTVTH